MKRLKRWQLNQRKYMFTLGVTDPTMVFCGIYKEIVTHHSILCKTEEHCKKCGHPFLGRSCYQAYSCFTLVREWCFDERCSRSFTSCFNKDNNGHLRPSISRIKGKNGRKLCKTLKYPVNGVQYGIQL